MFLLLPNGVMVARLPLEEKIGVRIPVRQQREEPIYFGIHIISPGKYSNTYYNTYQKLVRAALSNYI